jgi:hypothetical protein
MKGKEKRKETNNRSQHSKRLELVSQPNNKMYPYQAHTQLKNILTAIFLTPQGTGSNDKSKKQTKNYVYKFFSS